jgi:hypothetical protein
VTDVIDRKPPEGKKGEGGRKMDKAIVERALRALAEIGTAGPAMP